ncbi:MAG: helix-turn-helix domain-containing protein [Gammaproteobacteria bacterium]|nr:helix-turn-helix domain-containing protein [Gammaproteobacteria bacterium]MYC24317.1 helix-turn-helix domain-containing protein [Gammaproteobacteria bacterium]
MTTSIQDYEYVYGTGESEVKLKVKIPVHSCLQCELQYTDWEAEEIKHNALCLHFGVLNPNQIKEMRERHGMSRSAFAQLTGLGEASLNRWEKGINIQNLAHDRFLRLLNDPTIFNHLKRTVANVEVKRQGMPDNVIPFPNIKNREKLEADQRGFKLRASG